MSSTDYSYFNKNNYQKIFPDLPTFALEYNRLPLYSVYGTQVITYFLIAATALALGYVTLKEDESEKKEEEPKKEEPIEEEPKKEEEEPKKEEEEPKTEGGKKKKNKNKTKKRKHNRKNKSNHKK